MMTAQALDFARLAASYPERICDTDRGQISYREAGNGMPLVLLHGISSGAASWLGQLAGLEPHLRVIAWNAPGYGASTPLAIDAPKAADYAASLAAFVDAQKLDRFVLVGHSLGALMAAAYADMHPEKIAGLVLLSPARGYAEAERGEREGKLNGRLQRLEQLGLDGMAEARAAALVSANATSSVVHWIGHNMRHLHVEGYCQAARMLAYDDIGRYAAGFGGPVAVCSGDADNITPVAKCRAIAAEFHQSDYQSLAGLGHAFYLEAPAQANRLLEGLVDAANRRQQHD